MQENMKYKLIIIYLHLLCTCLKQIKKSRFAFYGPRKVTKERFLIFKINLINFNLLISLSAQPHLLISNKTRFNQTQCELCSEPGEFSLPSCCALCSSEVRQCCDVSFMTEAEVSDTSMLHWTAQSLTSPHRLLR